MIVGSFDQIEDVEALKKMAERTYCYLSSFINMWLQLGLVKVSICRYWVSVVDLTTHGGIVHVSLACWGLQGK